MGAALTYACRYALFTLGGLPARTTWTRPTCKTMRILDRLAGKWGREWICGGERYRKAAPLNKTHSTRPGNCYDGRGRRGYRSVPPVILAPSQSAELRDRLIAEIADISSSTQTADWPRKALPVKNTLAVADAQSIEQATFPLPALKAKGGLNAIKFATKVLSGRC
jgi:hypothetical protein